MSKIGIIIPIHEYNDAVKKYFDHVMKSIGEQKDMEEVADVYVVHKSDIDEFKTPVKSYYGVDVNYIPNDGDTSYQSQVNLAVSKINNEYFTVVEFDDELGTTFLKNAENHIKWYGDVDIFLSMIVETTEENNIVKLTNEPVWSQQFVGENGDVGYLNESLLKQYSDFKLSGAIIKKDTFVNVGMYKKNIKLTFMYEFLLRMLNLGYSIYTIPKITYKHIVGRENSLFDYYQKNMPMNERKFWFDIATKECVFTGEREIDTSEIN